MKTLLASTLLTITTIVATAQSEIKLQTCDSSWIVSSINEGDTTYLTCKTGTYINGIKEGIWTTYVIEDSLPSWRISSINYVGGQSTSNFQYFKSGRVEWNYFEDLNGLRYNLEYRPNGQLKYATVTTKDTVFNEYFDSNENLEYESKHTVDGSYKIEKEYYHGQLSRQSVRLNGKETVDCFDSEGYFTPCK